MRIQLKCCFVFAVSHTQTHSSITSLEQLQSQHAFSIDRLILSTCNQSDVLWARRWARLQCDGYRQRQADASQPELYLNNPNWWQKPSLYYIYSICLNFSYIYIILIFIWFYLYFCHVFNLVSFIFITQSLNLGAAPNIFWCSSAVTDIC